MVVAELGVDAAVTVPPPADGLGVDELRGAGCLWREGRSRGVEVPVVRSFVGGMAGVNVEAWVAIVSLRGEARPQPASATAATSATPPVRPTDHPAVARLSNQRLRSTSSSATLSALSASAYP